MHRIFRPSRSLLSCMVSGPPRGWLPTLARRVASVRGTLNPSLRHVYRFSYGSRNKASGSGVEGEELGKPDRRRLVPSPNDPIHTSKNNVISMDKHFPITRGMYNEENRVAIMEFITRYGHGHPTNVEEDESKIADAIYGDEDVFRTSVEVTGGKQYSRETVKELIDGEQDARDERAVEVSEDNGYEEFNDRFDNFPSDGSIPWMALEMSSHRDGSIYNDTFVSRWKQDYRITDRNETWLEAMRLSCPSKDCILMGGTCRTHTAHRMLQICSIKLVETPVVDSSIELYGYIAARDRRNPLLNYIVNIGRDNPIIVEQGSLIEMTGPKRGIDLSRAVLIEYDMRIKRGKREEDDLQLIDGVSHVDEILSPSVPVTNRIQGDCGAINITRVCLDYAFEATVEVVISQVHTSFNLCLSCFTSGLHEEIQLFDGVIGESRGLRRHVLAVSKHKCLDLKFKVGLGSECFTEHCQSFKATNHGCASEQIKIEFASIFMRVTWSAMK
uniref:DUF6598 domain-containing protein n=1 Tax=Leersia perrieri TaxID=77586 RepID=A0A0D9W5P3_9ORYZ